MMAAISIGLERHGGSRVIGGVVLLRQPSLHANRPIRATNSVPNVPDRVHDSGARQQVWGGRDRGCCHEGRRAERECDSQNEGLEHGLSPEPVRVNAQAWQTFLPGW